MRQTLGIVLGLAAGAAAAQALPVVKLQAGMHLIQAEVAADFASRAQGLMYRSAMASNAGMLFIFDEASAQCMWMKNTLIPLSVAFIDDSGSNVFFIHMHCCWASSKMNSMPTLEGIDVRCMRPVMREP